MAKKDKADKCARTPKGDKVGAVDKGERPDKLKRKDLAGSGMISTAVTQVARAMRTRLSHGLAESGLYPGQDGVIQLLAAEDGMTPGILAQRLGVKAPTMTRTIGRMEAQGFVTRHTDERDQRLTKVYLTDGGRNSLARINAAMAACEMQAIRGLSGKEARQLIKLLALVEDNLAARSPLMQDGAAGDEGD